jgi:hypothetical protein
MTYGRRALPDVAEPRGTGFTTARGFVPGAVVKWNGSARATTFVSRSQVKASILSSDIANAHNIGDGGESYPSPCGGTSNVAFFDITIPSSVAFGGPMFGNGSQPNSVATADFNGDGKLDLADDLNSNRFRTHPYIPHWGAAGCAMALTSEPRFHFWVRSRRAIGRFRGVRLSPCRRKCSLRRLASAAGLPVRPCGLGFAG